MSHDYEFHSLCKLFPVIPDSELSELAADIKANGLRQPILLMDGKIIDGRNRYLACVRAEVQPKFKIFKGDPASLVSSLNIQRRHLEPGQRALFAAELCKLKHGQKKSDGEPGAISTKDAAKLAKVSRESVKRARSVVKNGSEKLKEAVAGGVINLKKAALVSKLPKPEQRTVVKNHKRISELESKLASLPRGGLSADVARDRINKELTELRGQGSLKDFYSGPVFAAGAEPNRTVSDIADEGKYCPTCRQRLP